MTRNPQTIDRSAIVPDTPLRLDIAARIAYPDGSMTASGLRREIRKGASIASESRGSSTSPYLISSA